METWHKAWILSGIIFRQCQAAQARLGKGRGSHLEAIAQRLYKLQAAEALVRLALAGALDEEGALPAPLAAGPKERALVEAAGLEGDSHDPAALAYLVAWLADQGDPEAGRHLAQGFLARFPGHRIRSD
ncbi:hypothetical protein Mesil_3651 (plasmid) [Allomeiothermus silvanus DSM 9946]|uniref:Uncharacterized protein n=1 Tax=Allomeiothermus silvanus (strain ATCC 700542 / DSM 9946 / NBRC 106475 / NCIMB 13440 / VI-R2) TaxID=526227 RepID=D7BJT2_ALLS1|nr:hypothetical protein [Allomeiothermus silvanus]ADH65438.1 hypothetical protein Mesil_3651 [Allomeiothermus silvanus DSM 9946]